MKIALVAKPVHALPSLSTDYHTWAPGVVIASEAKALSDAGHDLQVYAASGSKVPGRLIDLGFPPLIDANKHHEAAQNSIRNVFDQTLYIAKVIEHIKQNPVDIIHIHDYRDYPMFELAGLGDKLICTIHGAYSYNFDNRIQPTVEFIKTMNLVALTEPKNLTSDIVEPVAVIPNTVDSDRFSYIDKPKDRVVYVGRFSSGKGADLLPEIARKLDVQIDVYGGSPTEQFDKGLLERFKSEPNINYLGRLHHTEVEQAFDAKALLFPSTEPEGFPLVLLEAGSRGTPVVAFDLPGIEQMVEQGTNGEVVSLNDLDAFAKAILNATRLDRKNCRKFILSKFGPEVFADKLESAFQKVISKSSK